MMRPIATGTDDFPAKILDPVPHRPFQIPTVDLPDMINVEDDIATKLA